MTVAVTALETAMKNVRPLMPAAWRNQSAEFQASAGGPADARGPGRLDTVELDVVHPGLTALLCERSHIQDIGTRLTGLHVAMAGSSADLAISLWLRFRAMVRGETQLSHDDHAIVRQHLGRLVSGGNDVSDPTPEALADYPAALEALGRWRASVHVLVAARCISLHSSTPTRVLHRARDSVVAHASDLDATIRRVAATIVYERDGHTGTIGRVEAIFVRRAGSRVAIRAVVTRPV